MFKALCSHLGRKYSMITKNNYTTVCSTRTVQYRSNIECWKAPATVHNITHGARHSFNHVSKIDI